MVKIIEKTVWANDETQVDEPPGSLKTTGYPPLDQPYNEHHNWIFNSQDKLTNRIIRERNLAQKFNLDISIGQQVGLKFGESHGSWVHPYLNAGGFNDNVITYGGNQPLCAAPAWDYTRGIPCVYVGRDGWFTGIESHFHDSGGMGTDSITLDFLEGTEYVESVVSEGEYFYVMTLGHSSGDAYFYRFAASPLSSTPLWSTSDTGANFKTKGRNGMCIAGDFLAYLRTNLDAGQDVVRLIRKADAGEFRQGEGNTDGLTLPSNFSTGYSIVSNGTSVFFAVWDGLLAGKNVHLVGADIADPSSATYPSGSWTPREILSTANITAGDLVFDGRLVHLLTSNGFIGSFDWTTNTWANGDGAIWHLSSAVDPPNRMDHAAMAFDGFYNWTLLEYAGLVSLNNSFISPVRCADTSLDYTAEEIPFALEVPLNPEIMIGPPKPASPVTYRTKMVYSDNALWIIPLLQDSPVGDTQLIRIPNLKERR